MGAAAKAYLLAYNLAQTAGWALALAQTVRALVADGNATGVYAAAGTTVCKFRRMHATYRPACSFRASAEMGPTR